MLTLPNGDKKWPIIGSLEYAEVTGAPIQQIQVVQHMRHSPRHLLKLVKYIGNDHVTANKSLSGF